MRIEFVKGETRRYRSIAHRPDGVAVEMDGGSYNKVGGPAGEVPHDIAHLVVEEELGLDRAVWGVLEQGGLFRGAKVAAGRRRPHASRRAAEILAASEEQLNQAEILTRAVCDQALAGRADAAAMRRAVGERWWSPGVTDEAVARAIERLHEAGERWAALAAGETLELAWGGRVAR